MGDGKFLGQIVGPATNNWKSGFESGYNKAIDDIEEIIHEMQVFEATGEDDISIGSLRNKLEKLKEKAK